MTDAVEGMALAARRHSRVSLWLGVAVFAALNALAVGLEPTMMAVAAADGQGFLKPIVDYRNSPRPDVLFMGSSRAMTDFDPRVAEREIAEASGTKISAVNLGLAGGLIDVNYLILKNVISDEKKPRVLVYGLTELELDAGFLQSYHQPYQALLHRAGDLRWPDGASSSEKLDFVLRQALPLYRNRELIIRATQVGLGAIHLRRGSAAESGEDGTAGLDAAPPQAATPPESAPSADERYYAAELAHEHEKFWHWLHNYELDEGPVRQLQEFVALARRRGIKVVLVDLPVNADFRSFWKGPGEIERYKTMVRGVAAALQVPLLELYDNPDGIIPQDAFADPSHLGGRGSGPLTRAVARRLLVEIFATAGQPGAAVRSGGDDLPASGS